MGKEGCCRQYACMCSGVSCTRPAPDHGACASCPQLRLCSVPAEDYPEAAWAACLLGLSCSGSGMGNAVLQTQFGPMDFPSQVQASGDEGVWQQI